MYEFGPACNDQRGVNYHFHECKYIPKGLVAATTADLHQSEIFVVPVIERVKCRLLVMNSMQKQPIFANYLYST
jgi:uncharacterized membrane protein YecN with MAPEG domain